MSDTDIKLFKDDSPVVAMPNISDEEVELQNKELESKDITEAISGKMVKTILVPEEAVIEEQNYIFDFSNTESITIYKREALKTTLNPHAGSDPERDVAIYLHNSSGKLLKIGYGDKYELERLIPLLKSYIFGDEIRIYKNFKKGCNVVEVKKRDITQLRLNL